MAEEFSDETLEVIIELQAVELDRLIAENNRLVTEASQLDARIDDMVQMQKAEQELRQREQVLRQQMQNQIDGLQERLALPSPETRHLESRLNETESNFDLLKQAVWKLVLLLEGREA